MDLDTRDKIIETHTDVKHLVQWAKEHTIEDNARFKVVHEKIALGEKIIYGAMGVFIFIEIIIKFIK